MVDVFSCDIPLSTLKPIDDQDLELMLAWRNEPDVRKNMYTEHEISWEEHVNWWNKIQHSQHDLYFLYQYHQTAYGVVAFNKIDIKNQHAVWAFYSAPNAPLGIGSVMEYMALEFAFQCLKLNKLNCEVLAFNQSVIALHKKFAFKEEGVFRQEYLRDEQFIDIHRLAILKEEWQQAREVMKDKIKKLVSRW